MYSDYGTLKLHRHKAYKQLFQSKLLFINKQVLHLLLFLVNLTFVKLLNNTKNKYLSTFYEINFVNC